MDSSSAQRQKRVKGKKPANKRKGKKTSNAKPAKAAAPKAAAAVAQPEGATPQETVQGLIDRCVEKGVETSERQAQAGEIASMISQSPKLSVEMGLFTTLEKLMKVGGKAGAASREGALLIVTAIANENLPLFELTILKMSALFLGLTADKQKRVGQAAVALLDFIVANVNLDGVSFLLAEMCKPTSSKISDLKRMKIIQEICTKAKKQMSHCLLDVIPAVAKEVHNIDKKVAKVARQSLKTLSGCCENVDVIPLIPILLEALVETSNVKSCVLKLASTTFVEIIDGTALAIICPILVSGLRSQNVAVKRGCARIADNLATLVEDSRDIAPFMPRVLPLLEKAAKHIPIPEARVVCTKACETLKTRAGMKPKTSMRGTEEVQSAFREILSEFKIEYKDAVLAPVVEYSTEIMTMCNRSLQSKEELGESLSPYVSLLTDAKSAQTIISRVQDKIWREADVEEEEIDDGAEVLCDCTFSLAFGNNVLLRKTRLKLVRGRRYGLIGKNDCGKTSMMRAIADHRVEGFPEADELRTIFVETDIPASAADLTVLDYVLEDPEVKKVGLTSEQVAKSLNDVGFVDGAPATLTQTVGTLSGGWRMKLALTRAMLLKADILLLDEPTNHLDTYNKTWMEDYLMGLSQVTSIFVSHDAGFLNKCCTNVIHIDKHRLHFYTGNLTSFAQKNPTASAAFFELKSQKFKFNFPNPGSLPGTTSKGKAIMKMNNITFTYPGVSKPQLNNVTIQVSLGSRVACVGVNGAGKSTMVKLLTGELIPDKGSGDVWSHPNCRVGYIAQNAFHHIENHMGKTANEYIRWRYQNGNDLEEVKKATNVVTPEEKAAMAKPIECSIENPETGAKTKVKYQIERLTEGRRTIKGKGKDQEYQCQKKDSMDTVWISRKLLVKNGWSKVLTLTDQRIAMRQGMYATPLTTSNVTKHMAEVGLEEEFSTHVTIGSLSGGQKVKVVLAAALWNRPHVLILDEPTNYLDRDSLGALAQAIREFEGGVIMITHNSQFCDNLCPTVWHLENNTLNVKGDAEWMKEMALTMVKEEKKITETTDKFGNQVKIKNKKNLSAKEKKKRAKIRAKRNRERRKQGLEEIFTSDEDSD